MTIAAKTDPPGTSRTSMHEGLICETTVDEHESIAHEEVVQLPPVNTKVQEPRFFRTEVANGF
jgi:hypothetical protein